MGQKPSRGGPAPISWWPRGRRLTLHPPQPIRFQYKTRRRGDKDTLTNHWPHTDHAHSRPPQRTKSEPTLVPRPREHHRRRRTTREKEHFGYEIKNVDDFFANASIDQPANIPVVLAHPTILYQTRTGGYQEEIQLPLGMVVNAVFKNKNWLYVQTPHAEEGYVNYKACLPLGIIPPEGHQLPCWEKSVFPKPSGNMTDSEKEQIESRSEGGFVSTRSSRGRSRSRSVLTVCEEQSVDRLYLKATATRGRDSVRQTLLAVWKDFDGVGGDTLRVRRGDVVVLINADSREWFWVRDKHGEEGLIPAIVARHGFL